MKYIGSKQKLLPFIKENIIEKTGYNPNWTVCDLFSGTGVVSKMFRNIGFKNIIANDFQFFSYVITKSYLLNKKDLQFKHFGGCYEAINYFNNNLEPFEGFVTRNFSPISLKYCGIERKFFTVENAMKIDAAVITAYKFIKEKFINESEFIYLLASILLALDRVSNTTSVYGAFLKDFSKHKRSLDPFLLKEIDIPKGEINATVYNKDALELIDKIEGDILYLDPPYNTRQYTLNYHVIETIAQNQQPELKGVSGLPSCEIPKSPFSSKKIAPFAFERLISNAKFNYVFIPYNNEGILEHDFFIDILQKEYKNVGMIKKEYRKYKSNLKRNGGNTVSELLFFGLNKK